MKIMFPESLQPLLTLLSDHPYAFIFVGLLFAGELVLLPAIYLAITGRLQIEYVFAAALGHLLVARVLRRRWSR